MRNVVLLLSGGFGNKGAEAIDLSTIFTLQGFIPNAEFVVITYCEEDLSRAKHLPFKVIWVRPSIKKVKAIQCFLGFLYRFVPLGFFRRLILKQDPMLNYLARACLVLNVGGYALNEVGGVRGAMLYCSEIIVSKLFGVPFVVYPQSMGPFETRLLKILVRVFLPWTGLIFARGEMTRGYLQQIGIGKKAKIYVSADIAFLFKSASRERALEIMKEYGVKHSENGLFGIVPNMRAYERCEMNSDRNSYVGLLCKLAEYIRYELGANIVFMPHEFSVGQTDDRWVIEQILKIMKDKSGVYVIDREYSSAELKALIGEMDALLASRFHSMIAALSMKVPVVVLGWSHKYYELMDMVAQGEHVFDCQDVRYEEIRDDVRSLWLHRTQTVEKLEFEVPKIEASLWETTLITAKLVSKRWNKSRIRSFEEGTANSQEN